MPEDNRDASVFGTSMFPMLLQVVRNCFRFPVWSMFCTCWFRVAPGGLMCVRDLLSCVYPVVQCLFVLVQPSLVNPGASLVPPC